MKIFLGADHAGYNLKEKIKAYLTEQQYDIEDLSPEFNGEDDYPDHAARVASKVSNRDNNKGILICGTGIGMSMAANKVRGIRAALCRDGPDMERARSHNDANILCLSGYNFKEEQIPQINNFLKAPFEGGRHRRRIDKLTTIEDTYRD